MSKFTVHDLTPRELLYAAENQHELVLSSKTPECADAAMLRFTMLVCAAAFVAALDRIAESRRGDDGKES